VSVGNLPPACTVVIKITYVTELAVDAGDIIFQLPNAVAPSQKAKASQIVTQTEHASVQAAGDDPSKIAFSFEASVQMPFAISSISSPTHDSKRIQIKKTDSVAVARLSGSLYVSHSCFI